LPTYCAPSPAVATITDTKTLAWGVFAAGHLGELTQQVPFEMVDAVLAETRTVQSRVRDLPSRVVVYLLLAACLFADLGYVQVWHRLVAGLDSMHVPSPTAGALTKARRRGASRCRRCLTCCAVRPPPPPRPACAGAGCWCARSTAPR